MVSLPLAATSSAPHRCRLASLPSLQASPPLHPFRRRRPQLTNPQLPPPPLRPRATDASPMNSTMTMEGANEFEGAFKKKMPPRAPRRRRAADDDDGETEDPNPGGAKKSGWGDSANEEGEGVAPAPIVPRRRRGGDDDGDETARKHDAMSSPNKHEIAEMEEGDNDTIANLIPDLEDEQLDMARQVAEAPHLTKSRVQSIQELDDEIDMALPSASEIGIDLSVLQSYLMPQEQVVEEDVPWDFSSELQSLASEMQQERDALKAGDEPVIHVAPLPKTKERVRKPLAEA